MRRRLQLVDATQTELDAARHTVDLLKAELELERRRKGTPASAALGPSPGMSMFGDEAPAPPSAKPLPEHMRPMATPSPITNSALGALRSAASGLSPVQEESEPGYMRSGLRTTMRLHDMVIPNPTRPKGGETAAEFMGHAVANLGKAVAQYEKVQRTIESKKGWHMIPVKGTMAVAHGLGSLLVSATQLAREKLQWRNALIIAKIPWQISGSELLRACVLKVCSVDIIRFV